VLPEAQTHRLFAVGDIRLPPAVQIVAHRAFTSRRISCYDLLASSRIPWSAVYLHYRFNLGCRQAFFILFALAQKNSRIEVACLRLGDNSVPDAVEWIAGSECRFVDQWQLGSRENRIAIRVMRGGEYPQKTNVQVYPVVAGISGKHSIVICRKPLRFGQRLFPAAGAAFKVRMSRKTARVNTISLADSVMT
jgi:hypothetical protein